MSLRVSAIAWVPLQTIDWCLQHFLYLISETLYVFEVATAGLCNHKNKQVGTTGTISGVTGRLFELDLTLPLSFLIDYWII